MNEGVVIMWSTKSVHDAARHAVLLGVRACFAWYFCHTQGMHRHIDIYILNNSNAVLSDGLHSIHSTET